jgi:hypothetical protein
LFSFLLIKLSLLVLWCWISSILELLWQES